MLCIGGLVRNRVCLIHYIYRLRQPCNKVAHNMQQPDAMPFMYVHGINDLENVKKNAT